jgi:hypothetical protein
MKAKLQSLMTGEVIEVYATTDSPDSSYGLLCWVDAAGNLRKPKRKEGKS